MSQVAPTVIRFVSSANAWWLWSLIAAATVAISFFEGLAQMVSQWSRDEYSYAYLVPPIAAAMIWQKRGLLMEAGVRGSWVGALVVLTGLALGWAGELATLYTVIHYALVITVAGIALTIVGWRGLRHIWAPLVYLVFVVPLPSFLYQGLSGEMQLISSRMGVALMRLFDVSVFLDGNIIDLGIYKLQVAEACSGLRYLFPLMSFGFLCAYLYRGPWWHRALLFASTGPITILVNVIRIAITGVLVEHGGIAMAEGFLHLFEGWIIFLAAVVLLFIEMWALARLRGRTSGFRDLLRLEIMGPARRVSGARPWPASRPFLAALALLTVAALTVGVLPARSEIVPEQKSFATFPLHLGDWRGQEQGIESIVLDVLKLDDYVMADYRRPNDAAPVNFYVAYYASQRKGASAHSPRSCIPGGGWEIVDLSEASVDGVMTDGRPFTVNRVIIAKGMLKQVVYYWFQQRGRHLTNEYRVKLMLFWDALTRNRTDGALVRLVTPLLAHEDVPDAERRLADFLRVVYPEVISYVPD